MRRNGQGTDRAKQNDAAVRRPLGGVGMGDVAARARFVVDHHTGANVLAQFLGNDARSGVRRAAGRKAHHHGDAFLGREVLCLHRQLAQAQGDEQGALQQMAFFHFKLSSW